MTRDPLPQGHPTRIARLRIAACALATICILQTAPALAATPLPAVPASAVVSPAAIATFQPAPAGTLLFLGNENLAPVVYLQGGVTSGLAVDLIRAMASHMSQPIEVRAMGWSQAQAIVASGQADALIQINETPARMSIYDFSDPFLESHFSIFVRDSQLGISDTASLRGLRVGVEAGGAPQQMLSADPQIPLTVIPDFPSAFRMLAAGQIDAVVVDYRVGGYFLATNGIRGIKTAGGPIQSSYSAIAVQKGNAKLLGEIDAALRAIKADGTYDKILDQWATTDPIFETQGQIDQRLYTYAIVALLILLLVAVAWVVSLRFQKARLLAGEREASRSAKRELDRASFLLEAAAELNTWTDLSGLLDALVGITLRLVPNGRVNIGIAARDRSSMTMAACGGTQPYPCGAVVPWERLTSGSRTALETGRSSIVDFEQLEEGGIANEYGSRLALFVALKFADRIVGQIGLDVPGERHDFTPSDIELVEGVASEAAVAIENARLYEDLRTQVQRASVLKDLAEIGVTGSSAREVSERFAQAVTRRLGASNAAVVLSDGERLRPAALVGYPESYFETLNPLPEDALAAQVFRSGEARFIVDAKAEDTTDFTRTVATDLGFGSFAALPLGPSAAPIGAVGLVWHEVRRFDAEESAFLSSVVAEAALAIQAAQLFESERESARLSDALNGVNRAVHSTLDIDDVMQHALDAGVEALGCDSGAIEVRDTGDWVVRYVTGFAPQDVGVRLSDDEAPNATRAEREGGPFQIEAMSEEESVNVGFVKSYDLKSVLAVPLSAQGAVVGCALLYTSKDFRRFTDAEMDFGRKLGSVVSLGLENARLYGVERDTAQTLQRALLTLPESVRDIDFAPAYRAATESTLVGGDFYDLFELDDDRVGITIGDISGKGLGAAVLTSLVKDTIRAHANERTKTPAQVLTLTNDLVYRSTPTEVFATVFFGVLDRRDGRMVYSNAAHAMAVISKGGGLTAKLTVTDPILGAFPSIVFRDADAQIETGDLLFLYTDGLTEARRGVELYGEARLFALLAASTRESAGEVVAEVMDDVLSFASGHLSDDLAILAVRRSVSGEIPGEP